MAEMLRVAGALRGVDHALRRCPGRGGNLLIDRTALAGSLARGTYSGPAYEPAGLVAFVNVDLQFGAYEVPDAMEQLAAAVRGSLEAAGAQDSGGEHARPRLSVTDAECRGGLWAEVTFPGPSGGGGAEPLAAAATSGSGAAAAEADVVVQIWLAENMRSGRAGAAPPPAAASSQAAGPALAATGDSYGTLYGTLGPVDPEAALQQQRNALGGVERAIRDAARRQARQASGDGGAGRASGAAALAAKLGCGFEEARRLFWSRQPPTVLRAAAAAHRLWHRAAAALLEPREPPAARSSDSPTRGAGAVAGRGAEGEAAGAPAAAGAGAAAAAGRRPELVGAHVLHLLDLLALHAAQAGPQPPSPEAAAAGGQHSVGAQLPAGAGGEAAVVRRLFELLATSGGGGGGGGTGGGGHGLYVAFGGGLLAQGAAEGGAAGAEGAAGLAQGGEAGSAPGSVVLDPCVPALNVFEAACDAVGGAQRLQAVAAKALELTLGERA